jgi:hypothetical protein
MRAMCPRLLAKARRRQAVALAKDAREVWRLAIADEARDIAYRNRRLLGQELRCDRQPTREQVLLKGRIELRIRPLDLSLRARHGASHLRERQALAVVARDDDTREQVEASAGLERALLHVALSDALRPPGRGAPPIRRHTAAGNLSTDVAPRRPFNGRAIGAAEEDRVD